MLITLRKNTPLPAAFAWSFVGDVGAAGPPPPFDVLPTRGEVPPGGAQPIGVHFSGSGAGVCASLRAAATPFSTSSAAVSTEPRAIDLDCFL